MPQSYSPKDIVLRSREILRSRPEVRLAGAVLCFFGVAILGHLLSQAASVLVDLLLAACFGYVVWRCMMAKTSHPASLDELLLREAFHGVLSPQLITDSSGKLVLANRAFRGWIDVGSKNALEVVSKRFCVSSETEKDYKALEARALKGQPAAVELPVIRGGRAVEWRRITVRPVEGIGNYYHWRFEDISERRRMERAMQDEQEKLLDFMAQAPVGIYSVNQFGRFSFVNQTLADWLQVAPDDLVNGDIHIHEIMGEPPQGVAAHAIAGGAHGDIRGEVVLKRRDGALFPVSITQTVVSSEDGKELRTRSIVRDLSPEREWQQALSFSEYRFQRLFAEAPIGIILLDAKLIVLECNHSFPDILGRARETVVNLPLIDLIVPEDRSKVESSLLGVLEGSDLKKPIEVRLASNREVITHIFARRFGSAISRDDTSMAPGLMLYFIDATEQKKLEAQFAQSQKMQAVGQLAGGVAHDFNNLLTAMIGFCDLLLQRHKPGDQSFSDIMQIKQNGNRAANLVRQLLAFSRQQTLQPKIINMADLMSELTSLVRRLIGAQVYLDVHHGRDLGLVRADQGQLEQVFVNLVVNARDAMSNVGTLTIRTGNIHQDRSAMRGQDEMPPGDYVAIEISDTGSGIPPEVMQRMFEPFFSTKAIGAGTGLGLSTVYGIVRQTGGFIGVDSRLGKGTTFTVYLPALSDSDRLKIVQTTDDNAESKAVPDLTGVGTILLVEDEDAVRIFSARALRNKGYKVLEARSGEEAVDVLNKNGAQVDLTITDVVMPQMDGPTLYKEHIKNNWPKMQVVFVSGYTEDRLREQFSAGEDIHFLGKPFSLKQLASKVKEIFDIIKK